MEHRFVEKAMSYDEKDIERAQTPPPRLVRNNSGPTRYVEMLLALDTVPRAHNILAAFATWILLAGFVLFPGTFSSLRQSQALNQEDPKNGAERAVMGAVNTLTHVDNMGLLYVAVGCCGVGILTMAGLWFRWRKNYIWIVNKIFMPGALNSLAGLMSTLINVYTAQNKQFSLTAAINTSVTGSCMLINLGLFVYYNSFALEKVRKNHAAETAEERKIRELVEERL